MERPPDIYPDCRLTTRARKCTDAQTVTMQHATQPEKADAPEGASEEPEPCELDSTTTADELELLALVASLGC